MSLRDQFITFRSSFQFKLFFVFTVLTAVMTILSGSLYLVSEIRQIRHYKMEQLQLLTRGLADSVRLPLYAENIPALQEAAHETLRLPEIRGVEILAVDGRLLVRVPATFSDSGEQLLSSTAEVRSSPGAFSLQEAVNGASDASGNLIGSVRLHRGTVDISREIRTLAVLACFMALLFWLLISFFSYRLLRRVTRSFQDLMQGLVRVHAGDYSSRIKIRFDDEPGRAATAVNKLAESLERREAEAARYNAERDRSRQELKNLLELLPVGIIWSQPDGTIEYQNRFMHERFGYTHDEESTINDWFSQICPDNDCRTHLDEMRQMVMAAYMNTGNVLNYDVKAHCKDGSIRYLACSHLTNGEQHVDIIVDMTEREQLQQQLIRNEKLEAVGVLAAGIAHNFNNALTGVMGFISFARKFLDTTHRSHGYLLSAEQATNRAAGLASQLLTFAKGGALSKKPASVVQLVEEAVCLATSGSRVVSHLDMPSSLHHVLIDENQICQAFSCICINAVQAMPDGGTLTIRGRNVSSADEKLPVPNEGNYVELSFEDQGCGIPEEHRDKVFLPYFTTKALVGTGLGLATAYSIITKHGGTLLFDSRIGAGTVFTLYLPAIIDSAAMQATEEIKKIWQEPILPSQSGILVLDDEEIIREFAREVLEDNGYRVKTCETGEEALALYQQSIASGSPFLAAILDLTIPGGGIDGKETAQQILACDPAARLIVSSGYSNEAVMQNYAAYGFCAAVTKPYQADELPRVLGQLRGSAG